MNIFLFLAVSALVVYLFAEYYPWGGWPTKPKSPHRKKRARIPRTRKTKSTTKSALPAAQERTSLHLQNLKPGDIVSFQTTDYILVDMRNVQESGWVWFDYILEDGEEIVQLTVDEEEEDLYLLTPTHEISISSPPPKALRYQHRLFRQTSEGVARVVDTHETFRYFTYEEPSGRVIVAEEWGDEFDVYVGKSISPLDLQFLPGSPENLSEAD